MHDRPLHRLQILQLLHRCSITRSDGPATGDQEQVASTEILVNFRFTATVMMIAKSAGVVVSSSSALRLPDS